MSEKKVFLPLITPFNDAGRICEDSVIRLMSYARPCVDGFVPCLTTGEGWLLSDRQWHDMLQLCVLHAGGPPVIAGIERPSTEAVIDLALEAMKLGAKGIICTAPFQRGLTQNAIYNHFDRIHNATRLDVYIYVENFLSNCRWDVDTLLDLCTLPRVKAIKDCRRDKLLMDNLRRFHQLGIKVYQGLEDRILEYESDGSMVAYCNLNPRLCRDVTRKRSPESYARLWEESQGLLLPEWCRYLKQDLYARGLISSPYIIGHSQDQRHEHTETTVPT